MSFSSKFNRGPLFDINTKDFPFKSLKDIYESSGKATIPFMGFYFSKKGNYGEQVVVISDKFLLNLPKHECDRFHDIAADMDAINDIKSGNVAIKLTEPYISHGKTCYGIEFVDC